MSIFDDRMVKRKKILTIENFDKIEGKRIGKWIIYETKIHDGQYSFHTEHIESKWNYPMIEVTIDRSPIYDILDNELKINHQTEAVYYFTATLWRGPTQSLPIVNCAGLKRKDTTEMYRFLDFMGSLIGNVQ